MGADDIDLSVALTRSTPTLSSPDLLYIIHGNGYFSQAVGDTSFPLWSPIAGGIGDNETEISDIAAEIGDKAEKISDNAVRIGNNAMK